MNNGIRIEQLMNGKYKVFSYYTRSTVGTLYKTLEEAQKAAQNHLKRMR